MLESAEGEKIGESKIAARQGISMVILSRIGMATPGMVRFCCFYCYFFHNCGSSGDDTHYYEQAGGAGLLQKVPKSPSSLAGEQLRIKDQELQFRIIYSFSMSDWASRSCAHLRDTNVLCHL